MTEVALNIASQIQTSSNADEAKRRDTARKYLKSARSLIKDGLPAAAVDILAIARDLSPNDREILSVFAEAHHRSGAAQQARALMSTLAAEGTAAERVKFRVHLRLAREALSRGAERDAAEHLVDHLRVDPADHASADQLLLLRLNAAPPSDRRATAESHIATFGRPPFADLALAIFVDRYDDPAGAAARIRAEPGRFAGQRDAALAAADVLQEIGDLAGATAFLSEMEMLFPEDGRFVQRRVHALVASGASRQAVLQAADSLIRQGKGEVRDRLRKMRLLASVRNWAAVVDEAEALLREGIFDVAAATLAIRGYVWLERDEEIELLLARCAAELGGGRTRDLIALARIEVAARRPAAAAGRLAPLYQARFTRAAVRADYALALAATGAYAAAWMMICDNLHHAPGNPQFRRVAARCGAAMDTVRDPRAMFPDALFEKALNPARASGGEGGADLVAIVTSSLAAGGAERQVALTATHVADRRGSESRTVLLARDLGRSRGNAVMIGLARSPHLEIEDMVDIDPTNVFRSLCAERSTDQATLKLIAGFPEELFREIIKLYARFRTLRPRVVHLWQDGRISVGSVAAVLAGVPRIVASVRNVAPSEGDRRRFRPFLKALYPALAAHPDVVLTANSMAGAADYERVYGMVPGSIRVLRNGVDSGQIRARAPAGAVAAVRAELGLSEGAKLVGGVFRLAPTKRPDLWLQVARRLAENDPDVRFVIVGTGVLRDSLELAAASYGLSGRLMFAGQRNPVEPWIAAMDAMLLVSGVEGVPNVVLEAAALGVPVVATDAGGTGEAILEGRTGRLVRDDNPDPLAAALGALLHDRTLLERARLEGPRLVDERFGMKRMVDETMAVYGIGGGPPDQELGRAAEQPVGWAARIRESSFPARRRT